jgi:hypothetical protein
MLNDYFNCYVHAHILGITAEIKKIGKPFLYIYIWFDSYVIIFCLTSEKYKIVLLKKKSLNTS